MFVFMKVTKKSIFSIENKSIIMNKFYLFLLVSLLIEVSLNGQTINTPDEFLGYELGTQFTYHQKAIDYFKYVDR
jgi:hypothetical protein